MKVEVPKEQLVYARILWYGGIISIVAITAAYIVYITGILPHYIEFDKIVELWGKKSHKFVEETNTPIGWEWLKLVMYGDFLNLLLLTVSKFSYYCLLPGNNSIVSCEKGFHLLCDRIS
jgi:hypothetical protein